MKKCLLALVAVASLAVALSLPGEAQAFGGRRQQSNAINAAGFAAANGGNFQASFGPFGNLRQVRSNGGGFVPVPVQGASFRSFNSFQSFGGSSCNGFGP